MIFSAQINDKIREQLLSFCASIQITARAVRGYLDRGQIRRFQKVMIETSWKLSGGTMPEQAARAAAFLLAIGQIFRLQSIPSNFKIRAYFFSFCTKARSRRLVAETTRIFSVIQPYTG